VCARDPRRVTALLFALAGAAFPATVYAVRASRGWFAAVPTEALAPGAALVVCLVTLSALCLLSGGLFAAASRLRASAPAEATGAVYVLEGAGSAAGGVLASLLLIRYSSAFEIAFLVAALEATAAAVLLLPGLRALLVTAAVAVAGVAIAPRLERASIERLWRGFRVAGVENSVYGNLVVVATEGSGTIYENGIAVATVPDRAAAEEAVHYALLEHPAPGSLLLIGGGVNGSLAQALQHRTLEHIDYVELDPALIGVARKYFPGAWNPVAANPRVHVHNMDGRLYLKTTPRTFDVIIVDLPEPRSAQLNRFYTVEFFREAARKLTPGGVFSFQLPASENYIGPERAALIASLRKTLGRAFGDVFILPGETMHFFAAARAGVLVGPARLIERLRERQLQTLYVREPFIRFRSMPDRVRELEEETRPNARTPVNRDFSPIAYYFDTTLWAEQFGQNYRRAFDAAARVPFGWIAAGLLLALVAAAEATGVRGVHASALFSAGAMGFAMMGLEIFLLLGFQAIYGYVYHQLAILTAMFMAGMALGAWRGMRGGASLGSLAALQVVGAAAPFAVYVSLESLGGPILSQVTVPALAVACGAIGGWQFAAASRVYFSSIPAGGRTWGALYATDLAGACAGALALSTYLIPVFGFLNTAAVISMVCLAPALPLLISARQRPAR
jgi:spermidine synthase